MDLSNTSQLFQQRKSNSGVCLSCACVLLLVLTVTQVPAAGPEKALVADTPAKQSAVSPVGNLLDGEIRGLKEQIAAKPADSVLHARLGYLFLKKDSLDEAQHSFDEALKLNSHSPAAMTGLGIVMSRRGNIKEAEQTLKSALVQNPNPVRAHYELGRIYEKTGNFEKAIAEYKEGINKYQQGRK
ncbi:MAG: tetratricopeptide repeat protein [Desulfuromonadales bacterium]|nr:tetratricopeptide repeat protein [Desulfuromonadales bacterium]